MLQDFGTVDEGSVLTYTFFFRNTGSDTLDVIVRSTCGCTAALLSDKNVPPGGIGKVRMEFKTQDRKGATSQSINVRTNDPTNQMLTLTMTAIVRGSVKVIPDRLWLDDVLSGAKVNREVLVVDSGDDILTVDKVRVPKGITVSVLPPRKDKSGLRVIPISLSVSVDSLGLFEKVITICTNDTRRKEIPLIISGTIQAKVKALPPRIFFGEVKPDSIARRELNISSTNGGKIEGLRATSGSPLVKIDLIPLENGAKYKMIASLNAPQNVITVRDSISVYLTDISTPVINIPMYAKVTQ